MHRTPQQLRADQAAILAAYREERSARDVVAVLPRPGLTAVTVYGRVVAIMTSDPTHGPHLQVQRQMWTGTPPLLADTAAAEIRCYPTPNHLAADYAVNETVRLAVMHGAMVAEKLG